MHQVNDTRIDGRDNLEEQYSSTTLRSPPLRTALRSYQATREARSVTDRHASMVVLIRLRNLYTNVTYPVRRHCTISHDKTVK